MENTEKRTRKQLSQNNLVKVLRHLDNNRSVVEGCGKSVIIDYVKNGIGIEMTVANLDGIANIEGYEWVIPPRKKAGDGPSERERALSQALVTLYERLGDEPPLEILEIAHG